MKKTINVVLLIILSFSTTLYAQEICNNGIDDNGNGLIDLNDPECACVNNGTPPSLIPNPSFEDYFGCPIAFSGVDSIFFWNQGTDFGTPDYYNTDCPFPFIPPNLPQVPDGNGFVGFAAGFNTNEHVAICLPNPLQAGTTYTIQLDLSFNGVNISSILCPYNAPTNLYPLFLYGNSDCVSLPVIGPDDNIFTDCPIFNGSSWYELGFGQMSTLTQDFQTLSFSFTPTVNTSMIMIGPPCDVNQPLGWYDYEIGGSCIPYIFVDNVILNTSDSFVSIEIEQSGSICDNTLILSTSENNNSGTYQWYQNGIALVGETNSSLNILNSSGVNGWYQVVFSLNGNCIIDSIEIDYTDNSVVFQDVTICEGESTTLTVNSGTNHSWSPAIGLNTTIASTVIASPSETTTYTVSYTDENSCVVSLSATIFVVESNATVDSLYICAGESVVLSGINGNATSCNWSPITQLSILSDCSAIATPESTTMYQVTGVNASGCSETASFFIQVNPLPIFTITTSQPENVAEVILSAEPTQFIYTWTTPENNTFIGNPVIYSFPDEISGNYLFTVSAESADGCLQSLSQSIQIIENTIFYIPNTFTPDGNHLNEIFLPLFTSGFDQTDYTFQVFNRWGELIFETNDYKLGWNGTYNGLSVADGTYVYKVIYKEEFSAKKNLIIGHVSLIR